MQRKNQARHSTVGYRHLNIYRTRLMSTLLIYFLNMEDMKQLSTDEKLNVILESMTKWGMLKYRIDNIETQVYINCASHEVVDQRMRLLEYISIDQEARSREANLIITRVCETNGEHCVNIATDLIQNNLNLEASSFVIIRAQRLVCIIKPRAPHLNPNPRPQYRSILVTFSHGSEVDSLMSRAYRLKGSNVGFTRDCSREISDARKALWSRFKEARGIHGSRNIRILYHAALEVNGRITIN